VLDLNFNLTKKSNLTDRLKYVNLVVAYFLGHPVVWRWRSMVKIRPASFTVV